MRIRSSSIFVTAVLLLSSNTMASDADFLDLMVPEFQVYEATVEESLSSLHGLGFLVTLEKLSQSPEPITFEVRGATLRQILDVIASPERGYQWQPYSSKINARFQNRVINVFPTEGRSADSVMETKIHRIDIKDADPGNEMLHRLHFLVPELTQLYLRVMPGGEAGSETTFHRPHGDVRLNLELRDLSLRAVLSEITLYSGVCWVYERTSAPWPHRWRVFE